MRPCTRKPNPTARRKSIGYYNGFEAQTVQERNSGFLTRTTEGMEPRWWVYLFNGPILKDAQGRVVQRFRSHRVGALLAYLALHLDRPCPREELAEAIWPEEDPETTANRLRVTLASGSLLPDYYDEWRGQKATMSVSTTSLADHSPPSEAGLPVSATKVSLAMSTGTIRRARSATGVKVFTKEPSGAGRVVRERVAVATVATTPASRAGIKARRSRSLRTTEATTEKEEDA